MTTFWRIHTDLPQVPGEAFDRPMPSTGTVSPEYGRRARVTDEDNGPFSRVKVCRMFSRPVVLASLLAASFAVPYTVNKVSNMKGGLASGKGVSKVDATMLAELGNGGEDPLAAELAEEPGSVLYRSPIPLGGLPAIHLEEVFRFDVTKDWVFSRWPRKSTALGDQDLYGVRVPLVSGTAVDDVAGSLTYYFNAAGQAERIAFSGATGDARRLVNLVANRYGLQPVPPTVAGEQLYQRLWNGRPQSELRIRPAAVVWSSSPHSSYDVNLVLQRPGSNRFLR